MKIVVINVSSLNVNLLRANISAEIKSEYQYGISNEVIPGETASVSVQEGSLLLMQIYRDPQTEENRKRGKDPV